MKTKEKEEVSKKIKTLVGKNMDMYKEYLRAAEFSKDMNLRDYLIDQATDRKAFAQELMENLKTYDPELKIEATESLGASIHRGWINLKSIVTGSSDKQVLEECINGDRASIKEYEDFLNNNASANPEITREIQNQLKKIVSSLDNSFRLEDNF